jgi:TRAP-type C4-dicarboxylate transport system permease small subunit
MALCDRMGGHIAVDIFESRLPRVVNRMIDIAAAGPGAVIFAMIAWAVWESAVLSQMLNLSTNLLRLPKAWFQWAFCGLAVLTAAGMALLAGAELALTGRDLRATVPGHSA